MRETTGAALALCALAAVAVRADEADPEPPDDAKQVLKQLSGRWAVARQAVGGRELSPGKVAYTFDGDKLTCSIPTSTGAEERRFRVKLSTKKRPHTVELVPEGGGKGRAWAFKIEKGELHLAIGGAKGEVPANFKGDTGALVVLRREGKKGRG